MKTCWNLYAVLYRSVNFRCAKFSKGWNLEVSSAAYLLVQPPSPSAGADEVHARAHQLCISLSVTRRSSTYPSTALVPLFVQAASHLPPVSSCAEVTEDQFCRTSSAKRGAVDRPSLPSLEISLSCCIPFSSNARVAGNVRLRGAALPLRAGGRGLLRNPGRAARRGGPDAEEAVPQDGEDSPPG